MDGSSREMQEAARVASVRDQIKKLQADTPNQNLRSIDVDHEIHENEARVWMEFAGVVKDIINDLDHLEARVTEHPQERLEFIAAMTQLMSDIQTSLDDTTHFGKLLINYMGVLNSVKTFLDHGEVEISEIKEIFQEDLKEMEQLFSL